MANDVISLLEKQAQLLWEWRCVHFCTKNFCHLTPCRDWIISLLSQKLSFDGEEAEGQEYMRGLETQNDAESYLQSWAALVADRKETLIAERTILSAHEDKDVNQRITNR